MSVSLSIYSQLIVGVLFVVIGSLNINRLKDQNRARILNDVILVFIFVISIDNVIISGFGIEHSSQPLQLRSLTTTPSPPLLLLPASTQSE